MDVPYSISTRQHRMRLFLDTVPKESTDVHGLGGKAYPVQNSRATGHGVMKMKTVTSALRAMT